MNGSSGSNKGKVVPASSCSSCRSSKQQRCNNPPPPNENIVFCYNRRLTSNLPGASCLTKCSPCRLPPPSSCSGLGPLCSRRLEGRSLDKAGLNEDICFHSGSAGTRPPLLSETISRHLLAADCSGRFLPLPSPSTPPSGLRKVLHRSPRCVASAPARSDLEGEKIDTGRKRTLPECSLSVFLFQPDYGVLIEHLLPVGENSFCWESDVTTCAGCISSICLKPNRKPNRRPRPADRWLRPTTSGRVQGQK